MFGSDNSTYCLCITGIRHFLLPKVSTSVFYFNKLFFSKSRANIARILIGYGRVIPFASFSASWAVVMFIKNKAKMSAFG